VCFPDVRLDEEGSTNHPCDEPRLEDRAHHPARTPGPVAPWARRPVAAGHDEDWRRHRSLPVRPLGAEH
jgi:hypothetical protein